MTDFQKNIVCDINNRVNRAETAHGKSALHPLRAFKVLYIINVVTEIARAQILVDNLNRDIAVSFFGAVVGIIGCFERLFEERRNLARDTENRLTIGTICGNRDIENVVVQAEIFHDILADGSVLGENENSVYGSALNPVVVNSKLAARAEHTVAHHILHLARLNFQTAGEFCSDNRRGYLRTLENVIRAR